MDKSTYIPDAPEVESKPVPVEQVKVEASKILSEKFSDYGFVDVGGMSYEDVRRMGRE